jgi:hypothetical protein
MGRLSRSLGRRTKRLLGEARLPLAELQEAWTHRAVARLTDQELHCLRDALRREKHLEGKHLEAKELLQLGINAEERAALERFYAAYAEEIEASGWGA